MILPRPGRAPPAPPGLRPKVSGQGSDPQPLLSPVWVEKTLVFTFNMGWLGCRRLQLRTRQPWKPFTEYRPEEHLPEVDARQLEGVDAVAIPGVPMEPSGAGISFPRGLIRYAYFPETRYLITIEGTFNDYIRSRSAPARQNLNRSLRTFRRISNGEVRIEAFHGLEAMRRFYSLASPLARKTWQHEVGRGLEDLEPRDDILRLAEAGRACGYILFAGTQAVAFHLSHIQGTTLVGSQMGYDPDFAAGSPGSVLDYLTIEKLFAEGQFTTFDMMEGSTLPHKSRLATTQAPSMRLLYFPRNLRSLGFVLAHWLIMKAGS